MADQDEQTEILPPEQEPPQVLPPDVKSILVDESEPSPADLRAVEVSTEDGYDDLEDLTPATDPITRYLREIGRTALLSAKEEVDLARTIERGKEARAPLADAAANLTP